MFSDNSQFNDFKDYVLKYWRPSTELYIKVTKDSDIYNWLTDWFSVLKDPTVIVIPDDKKVDIGPYVGVQPYSYYLLETDSDGVEIYEFLFLYDSINHKELTGEQLLLGRSDFVDLFQ